jgi:NADH-quinone oxidoreductase subunit L
MFLACGVGAFTAGVFHVVTHAFFKALLFLGSGSVIHGMHEEQDIRRMGGLKKYMPITFATMMAGWLAISGFPLLSGFFSKDEILWKTWSTTALPHGWGRALWVVAALTALLTAIYMTRMMVLTFFGESRFGHDHAAEEKGAHGGHDAHDHGHNDGHESHGEPHESPAVMWVPLAVLAVLSIVGGFVGVPAALGGSNHFEHFLEPVIAHVAPHEAAAVAHDAHGVAGVAGGEEHHDVATERLLTGVSVLLGFLGIGIGFAVFRRRPLRRMPKLLEEKYYVDEAYEASVIQPLETTSRDFLWKGVDVRVIDGAVNGVARSFAGAANLLRYTQTGSSRNYAAVILIGAIILIGYFGYMATR